MLQGATAVTTRLSCQLVRVHVHPCTHVQQALLSLCRVVPDGMLVFFPSYGLLDTLARYWKVRQGVGGCWVEGDVLPCHAV